MNTPRRLSKTLDDAIFRIEQDFDHADKDFVLDEIFHMAALYWEGLNEEDFQLSLSTKGNTFTFGEKNVITWSPGKGFELVEGSPEFRAKYEGIGPLPERPGSRA